MNADELIALVEPDENDPRIQAAIEELRALITASFPEATFSVYRRDDPDGIYLTPFVDVDDLGDVIDVVSSRLVDLQVDEGLPVYVVPDWTAKRLHAYLQEQKTRQNTWRVPELAPLP